MDVLSSFHLSQMCRLLYVAVQQFYCDTMEVSDELKSDSKTTALDTSITVDVTAVADTNDVDMKTEEGCYYLCLSMTC